MATRCSRLRLRVLCLLLPFLQIHPAHESVLSTRTVTTLYEVLYDRLPAKITAIPDNFETNSLVDISHKALAP